MWWPPCLVLTRAASWRFLLFCAYSNCTTKSCRVWVSVLDVDSSFECVCQVAIDGQELDANKQSNCKCTKCTAAFRLCQSHFFIFFPCVYRYHHSHLFDGTCLFNNGHSLRALFSKDSRFAHTNDDEIIIPLNMRMHQSKSVGANITYCNMLYQVAVVYSIREQTELWLQFVSSWVILSEWDFKTKWHQKCPSFFWEKNIWIFSVYSTSNGFQRNRMPTNLRFDKIRWDQNSGPSNEHPMSDWHVVVSNIVSNVYRSDFANEETTIYWRKVKEKKTAE